MKTKEQLNSEAVAILTRLEDYGIDTEQLVICLDEVGVK